MICPPRLTPMPSHLRPASTKSLDRTRFDCALEALLCLSLLACCSLLLGCSGQLLLPSTTSLSAGRQQCVECGLRGTGSLRDKAAARSNADAAKKFDSWCSAGDPASCSALGVMYETGRGVQQDLARAEQLYQHACRKRNSSGCVNLGRLLTRQNARHRDPEAAKMMFELPCMQGNLDGCFELGKQHHLEGNHKQAAAALKQGCGTRHGASCETLATLYQQGLGVPQNTQRAHHLLRDACLSGRTSACERLSRLTRPQRRAKASTTSTL